MNFANGVTEPTLTTSFSQPSYYNEVGSDLKPLTFSESVGSMRFIPPGGGGDNPPPIDGIAPINDNLNILLILSLVYGVIRVLYMIKKRDIESISLIN